jgi:hypothetical protein
MNDEKDYTEEIYCVQQEQDWAEKEKNQVKVKMDWVEEKDWVRRRRIGRGEKIGGGSEGLSGYRAGENRLEEEK